MNTNKILSILILFTFICSCEKEPKEPILNTSSGFLFSMGANKYGILGDSSEFDRYSPYLVSRYSNITQIDASSEVSMALTNKGYVLMWGNNDVGQLGIKKDTDRILYPKTVVNIPKAICISTGGLISAIVDINNNVWIWGTIFTDDFREKPLFSSYTPKKIDGLSNIIDVECGAFHCLALDVNGEVWAWGRNVAGSLGDGTTETHRMTPKKVKNLSGVKKISTNGYFSLALLNTGQIYSWGYNLHGELGNNNSGGNAESYVPVKVLNIDNATDIAAGSYHSLCLTSDKKICAWGEGRSGQLGNGDDKDYTVPIQINSLSNVKQIDACGSSSTAITEDGLFWAWGNYKFHTYDGVGYSGNIKTTPTKISCLNNAIKMACGGYHYMIIKESSSIDSIACYE
jgi:alpha-tubulin suppressor-like RCC1 family protein